MQEGILFHTLYASEPGVYSVQWSCRLSGNLQVTAFKRAWQRVADMHTTLRTAFNWELRDEPFQIVYKHVELSWRQHDWRNMSAVEQEQELEVFLAEDRAQSFELSKAPLMRLALCQLSEGAYEFVWSLHHLLLDGWSRPVLLRKVFLLYDAFCTDRELHLEAGRPYDDYIAWLQRQDLSQAAHFWRQTLKGFTTPTALNVGNAYDRSSSKNAGHAEQQMRLSAAVTADLQALAQQHQLSLNTLVQGAWALLLSRYSGQEDVVFGVTVAARPAELEGVESMVGLFINTLPVRAQVSPKALLIPWLQERQNRQVEALQYEFSPLVHVQGWSDVPRGRPLFESLVVFENYPARTSLQEWSSNIQIRRAHLVSHTSYPVTVVACLDQNWGCASDTSLTALILRRLPVCLTTFGRLLESMVTDPAQRLADLPMLTQPERHQLLVEWNIPRWHMPRTQGSSSCLRPKWHALRTPWPSCLKSRS